MRVGPYCVIGPEVELGPGCELYSHVRVDGPLVAGSENRFFHGAAIGGIPQDLKYSGARSRVVKSRSQTKRSLLPVFSTALNTSLLPSGAHEGDPRTTSPSK